MTYMNWHPVFGSGAATGWTRGPWDAYINQALTSPAHHDIYVPLNSVPHPANAGVYFSFGLGNGQLADWRLKLSDGRGIHVRAYGDHYTVHWDYVDPSVSIIDHLEKDAPEVLRNLGPWMGLGLCALILAMAE